MARLPTQPQLVILAAVMVGSLAALAASQPLNKEQLLSQLAYDFDKGERMLLNFLSMERNLQQDEKVLNEMLNDMQKAMPFMAEAARYSSANSDGDNIRMTRRKKRSLRSSGRT